MPPSIPRIDLRMADLQRLVDRTRHTPLTEDEYTTLKAAIDTLGYVAELVEAKGTTLAGLRQLLFGATTETTRAVLKRAAATSRSRTPSSIMGIAVPPARRARSIRNAIPASSFGSSGRRRSRRASTRWKNCAVISAANSSPPIRRRASARTSTTRRPGP